jgi:beta-glucosidase
VEAGRYPNTFCKVGLDENNDKEKITSKAMNEHYPYQDASLSIDQRVEDLLSRMTWEEKAAQLGSLLPFTDWGAWFEQNIEKRSELTQALAWEEMVQTGSFSVVLRELPPRNAAQTANKIHQIAREKTRLGIPPIIHDEGLHGLLANDATSFPQSIAMASSWNPELLEQIAGAIGRETRSRGIRQLLSPTINIARDPRCGRTEETYGEDPFLASRMAVAFVRGVETQGVVTTPKHYAANFVGDGGRDSYPIHFSERLMREIYFPAFEAAVREGGARSIMAAYNSYDGLPCSCNPWLLSEVLRNEWGFTGFVVSDYGSVVHVLEKHAVAADKSDVARRTIEAGLDVELPATDCYGAPLLDGIHNGTVSKEAVDAAVRNVLMVKFELGLFDEPFVDENQAEAVNHNPDHVALALKMARQGLVLLKNADHTLPFSKDIRSLAVIGPQADEIRLGGYSWYGYSKDRVVTPLRGLQELLGDSALIHYVQGCDVKDPSQEGFAAALRAVQASEAVVLFMGNSEQTEGEQRDRATLDLPGAQEALIQAIAAVGKPLAVVLINGSAITMGNWIEHVPAVLEAWYPGEQGGRAIAEALFGDANPGGKLPVTFPRTTGQLPLYYNHKPSGRIDDYADQSGKATFPFGHGLSYTTFEYRDLRIHPQPVTMDGIVTVTLDVQNTGERAGDEVVQLYIHDLLASVARPLKELKAFLRISLEPGETRPVTFLLEAQKLGLYDAKMQYVVEPGEFEVMVGSSSEDIRLAGKFEVVS